MKRSALDLIEKDRPLIIAHRGYSGRAPENTLPSFCLAFAASVDLIELDIQQTKDGQLIVFHDRKLDRTTDARSRWKRKHIPVEAKTATEILSLDAGAWFAPSYTGTRVPLLSEALDTIQYRRLTLIERKTGDPLTLLKLLREKAALAKVIVQSFDWAFICELHQLEPNLVLAALGPPVRLPNGKRARGLLRRLNRRTINTAQQTGAKVIVWNKQISKHAAEHTHSRGLKVWTYTIDDPKLARRLLKRGVDGFITNNPSLVSAVLRE